LPSDPVLAKRLLHEVLQKPHADGPRLIYADWLTEHGDPRGSFITEQCRLASLDEAEHEWCRLFASSQRALSRYGPSWTRPLGELLGISGEPEWFVFRRGFVERVAIGLQSPRQLEALAQHTPLCAMTLASSSQAPAFATLASRLGLHELELHASSWPGSGRSPGLALLEQLDLSKVEILSIHSHFSIEEMRQVASLLEGAPLRALALSGVGLTSAGAGHLARGRALGRLERLDLSNNDLGIRGLRRVTAALGSQPVRLRLEGNEKLWGHLHQALDGRSWRALNVEELVTDDLFEQLAQMESQKELRELRLGVVRDEQAQRLASLGLSRLTRLEIGGGYHNPLCLAAWRALCDSSQLSCLVELSARGTGVGDEGIEALVRSSQLTRLTRLDLSNVRITARGARALAAWPGLAHLVDLDLSGNPIGSEGVRALLASALDPTRLILDDADSRALWPALVERFGRAVAQV
jgi:uncharacterized protein (TIGR02996 family)